MPENHPPGTAVSESLEEQAGPQPSPAHDRFQRMMALFDAACALPIRDRALFIERQCSDDAELKRDLLAMIDKDEKADTSLFSVGAGVRILADGVARTMAGSLAGEGGPSPIPFPVLTGQYRIIRKLGEGGMGTVYEAEQARPRRTVALKAIRPGNDSRQVLKRFEFEAQILARLQHPGIAQIYEAGAADGDHPDQAYFAMEYVPGLPLDQFANQRKLTAGQRLALLAKVCDAVHYAHQKAIIHRDLKPANILVVESEEAPTDSVYAVGQPKILDFGVARSTSPDEQMPTIETNFGQLVGTLPYMSPEQVHGDPEGIDTRTDVYTLGVIGYQLLSGALPHDCRGISMPEAVRRIRETTPASLGKRNPALRGDVEIIIAKAMEKDRTRRYQSALQLGSDIRRYLSGDPIDAKGDSALYVLRKTIRRHRAVASIAAILAITIVLFAAVSFHHARVNRAHAIESQRTADENKELAAVAVREKEAAIAESLKARSLADFLLNMLQSADPRAGKGRNRSIMDALDYAAGRVSRKVTFVPDVEAEIRTVIGQTYYALGEYNVAHAHVLRAAQLYEQLSEPMDKELAGTLNTLGCILVADGKPAVSEATFREAAKIARYHDPAFSSELSSAVANLGAVCLNIGDFHAAECLIRESLLLENHAQAKSATEYASLVATLGRMVFALSRENRTEEAEEFARRAVVICHEHLPEDHPHHAAALNNLATVLQRKGAKEEAESLFRDAVRLAADSIGDDHPDYAYGLINLGDCIREQNPLEAEMLFRRAIEIRREKLRTGHPNLAEAISNLGGLLVRMERAAEAEPLLRESLDIRRKAHRDHYLTAHGECLLGRCLMDIGNDDEAERLLESGYQKLLEQRGPSAAITLTAKTDLIQLYKKLHKTEQLEHLTKTPEPGLHATSFP